MTTNSSNIGCLLMTSLELLLAPVVVAGPLSTTLLILSRIHLTIGRSYDASCPPGSQQKCQLDLRLSLAAVSWHFNMSCVTANTHLSRAFDQSDLTLEVTIRIRRVTRPPSMSRVRQLS